jgi:hypothetical protein
MTNIPYDEQERSVWMNSAIDRTTLTNGQFKSALRIDLFMKKSWQPIADVLAAEGYAQDKNGLKEYLEKWIDIMNPEYLMVCELNIDVFEYKNLFSDFFLPKRLLFQLIFNTVSFFVIDTLKYNFIY